MVLHSCGCGRVGRRRIILWCWVLSTPPRGSRGGVGGWGPFPYPRGALPRARIVLREHPRRAEPTETPAGPCGATGSLLSLSRAHPHARARSRTPGRCRPPRSDGAVRRLPVWALLRVRLVVSSSSWPRPVRSCSHSFRHRPRRSMPSCPGLHGHLSVSSSSMPSAGIERSLHPADTSVGAMAPSHCTAPPWRERACIERAPAACDDSAPSTPSVIHGGPRKDRRPRAEDERRSQTARAPTSGGGRGPRGCGLVRRQRVPGSRRRGDRRQCSRTACRTGRSPRRWRRRRSRWSPCRSSRWPRRWRS